MTVKQEKKGKLRGHINLQCLIILQCIYKLPPQLYGVSVKAASKTLIQKLQISQKETVRLMCNMERLTATKQVNIWNSV